TRSARDGVLNSERCNKPAGAVAHLKGLHKVLAKRPRNPTRKCQTMNHTNNFPKLHNAAWPGVVGKGSPGAEPFIGLDTMLDLTAKAEVDGVKFDGVDLFLFEPHVSIDSSDDDLKRLADKVRSRNLVIGSVVAPV